MFDEYVFLIMETHRDKLERQFQNSSFQKFLAMSGNFSQNSYYRKKKSSVCTNYKIFTLIFLIEYTVQFFLKLTAKSNTTAPDCSPQGDNANKPGRFLSNTGVYFI